MKLSKLIRWVIVPAGVLGMQSLAVADTISSNNPALMPDTSVSVLRVLGALILVLAIFFAGVWLFKNSQRALSSSKSTSQLQVLEAKSLGNRQTVFVVGYGRQRLLLGSSPGGIALVSQLPEAGDAEPMPAPANGMFSEVLQKVLNRK